MERTGQTTRKITECIEFVARQSSDATFYVHHASFIPGVIRTFMDIASRLEATKNMPVSASSTTVRIGDSFVFIHSLATLQHIFIGFRRPSFVDHHAKDMAVQAYHKMQKEVEEARKVLRMRELEAESFQAKMEDRGIEIEDSDAEG